MRALATVLVALVVVGPVTADKKKSNLSAESLTELHSVRTVFIDGNSESADKIRDKIEIYTCLKTVNNKSKADAIVGVDEQARRADVFLEGGNGSRKISDSVIVTMANGDQVWDKNKLGQGGLIHTGAGSAATDILRALAKDACPGWTLRNEGAEGSHFHKDYVRPEPKP